MLKSLEELKRTRGECLEGLERKGDLSFIQRIDTSIYRQWRVIKTKEIAENISKSLERPWSTVETIRKVSERKHVKERATRHETE